MRTNVAFFLLVAGVALLNACGGQQTPSPFAPAGQSQGMPTLLYVFADP